MNAHCSRPVFLVGSMWLVVGALSALFPLPEGGPSGGGPSAASRLPGKDRKEGGGEHTSHVGWRRERKTRRVGRRPLWGPMVAGLGPLTFSFSPPLFGVFLSVSGSAVPRPKPEMTHHRSAVFAQPRHQNIQIVIVLGTFLRQGGDLAICGSYAMNGFDFFPQLISHCFPCLSNTPASFSTIFF